MSLSAEDSLEILQLVARADNCATARDADGYAALFTDDAAMTGRMGEAHCRAELIRAVARVWAQEPEGTLHLTLNAVLETSGDETAVSSVMLMIGAGGPDFGNAVVGAAQVRQTVEPTAAGWRISSRQIR